MNKSKKPKIIIFFIILFAWMLLKNIAYLSNYEVNFTYKVLANFGVPFLFFIYSVLSIFLILISLWYLIKPKLTGFYIIAGALMLGLLGQFLMLTLSIKNPSLIIDLYVESRAERGFSLSESKMEFLSDGYGIYLMSLFSILIIGILIYLIYREKSYFFKEGK